MASETPFSFHCIICFEEFHPDVRYPVVLPCGHTYVCNLCANRLEKCMECRTPLHAMTPRTLPSESVTHRRVLGAPATARSPWASARAGRAAPSEPFQQDHPAHPPTAKSRLPLPRNVVLLSLIEATELATQDIRKKHSNSMQSKNSRDANSFESADSKDEEEKIRLSTSLATGDSGTYAVALREGLEIYPSRPPTKDMDGSSPNVPDEDVETLVRFFHMDQNAKASEECTPLPAARLSYGDRVQIVSVNAGWAKLARGYGFIKSDKNLVKVGGCVDKACKLEAMLRTLSRRRKELRREQSQVDNQFITMMSDLQASLQNTEDLTVICADAFAVPETKVNKKVGSADEIPATPAERLIEENIPADEFHKPSALHQNPTRPSRGGLMCFASEVFDQDNTEGGSMFSVSPSLSSNSVLGSFLWSASADSSPRRSFPAASYPSPSELRAGARAWRELHGREPSSAVDFRTGLSGHTALLSSHAGSHDYYDPPRTTPSRGLPKMSSHMGLSVGYPRRGRPARTILDRGTGTTPGDREALTNTGSV